MNDAVDDRATATLTDLWRTVGGDANALNAITLTGDDPVLPGIFHVGELALASIGAAGLAAAELHRLRTGQQQTVSVDATDAVVAFRGERYLLIDGKPPPSPWGNVSGYYPASDGALVQLHANFVHHEAGFRQLLECPADGADAIRKAVSAWGGQQLEDAAIARGLPAGMLRSREAWLATDQAQALSALPLIEIERVADSPPEALPPASRPLGGVKVLDLTRIIAGPVGGRTLAAHGADVLRLASPSLPFLPHLWLDLARGKRSAHLDLKTDAGVRAMTALVRDADIFMQAYRPHALAQLGFGVADVQRIRPGAIYISLSAFGHTGPWADRRGFDSLVQTVSGIGQAGAAAADREGTRPLPCQALDHATGYLAALGATCALKRRAIEGGSYAVRISLAQTSNWLWSLGTVNGIDTPDLKLADIEHRLEVRTTSHGEIKAIAPAERLSATPAHYVRDASLLGADAASF